jgi:hypothetical protein
LQVVMGKYLPVSGQDEAPSESWNHPSWERFQVHPIISESSLCRVTFFFIYSLVINNAFLSGFPLELFFHLVSEYYFLLLNEPEQRNIIWTFPLWKHWFALLWL